MLGFLRKKQAQEGSSGSDESIPQMVEHQPYGITDAAQSPSSDLSEKAQDDENWIDAHEGYQLMAAHLWKLHKRRNFFSENEDIPSGVALRFAKGQYVVCPADDDRLDNFCRAVIVLNCEAAMTITSPVVTAINTRLAPGTDQIPITPSQHIQVVETMEQLAGTRKAQNACFIRRENTVVIWCDHVEQFSQSARDLEEKMIKF
ncbi:hypothetical protein, partial [Sporisorium scitamineum]